MTPAELDDFVRRYFREEQILRAGSREERVAGEQAPLGSQAGFNLDLTLWRGLPGAEEAWPLILALVERAPDDEALAFVAAGPLEDLVRRHGVAFADRLIGHTRRDPRFRQALAGIWGWEDLPQPLRGRLIGLLGLIGP
jgi:hypothetical protein